LSIRFDDQVVIVTGGGNGLGRSHCMAYAKLGAKVLVNDLGGNREGHGASLSAAETVAEEIRAAGGEALANGANVTSREDVSARVQQAMDSWGRVDVLVNNPGILRDKSFSKMELSDFDLIVDVHLLGAANCTKAVGPIMGAGLRAHRDDLVIKRALWKLRTVELFLSEDGPCWTDEHASPRGKETRYSSQHTGTLRRYAHARRFAPRRG